jgi:hypothetical protein
MNKEVYDKVLEVLKSRWYYVRHHWNNNRRIWKEYLW